MSKCRPNFYQTSTPPVSTFGRSLLDICMNHIVSVIRCRPHCDTKLRPNVDTHIVQHILFDSHIKYVHPNKYVILSTTLQQQYVVSVLTNQYVCLYRLVYQSDQFIQAIGYDVQQPFKQIVFVVGYNNMFVWIRQYMCLDKIVYLEF